MSSSKSRDKRRDKYNPEPDKNFMIHRGQKVPLGGAAEMLRHCDEQWYAYLERLVKNPKSTTPLSGTKALTFGKDSRIAATSA